MKTFLLMLLPFCVTGVMARTAFDKTGKVAQVGIGLGGLGGFYGTSSLPVISVGLDFGFHDYVSIGGVAGYSSSKIENPILVLGQSYSYKYSYITLGARGSYHFLQIPNEKLDLYAGLGLGFNIVSSKYTGTAVNQALITGSSGSYMFLGFHAGGRYYFSPNFAAYAELGYGLGILNIGIAFRL